MPPLLFDDEQAVAVVVALQTASTGVAGIDEAAVRALATVRQVMPARLRHRGRRAPGHRRHRAAATARRSTSEVLLAIGAAVRAHEVLRFDYDGRQRHAGSPAAPRPTTWSPGAAAGTWSATTSTAPTGARTAWTG